MPFLKIFSSEFRNGKCPNTACIAREGVNKTAVLYGRVFWALVPNIAVPRGMSRIAYSVRSFTAGIFLSTVSRASLHPQLNGDTETFIRGLLILHRACLASSTSSSVTRNGLARLQFGSRPFHAYGLTSDYMDGLTQRTPLLSIRVGKRGRLK